MNRLTSVSSRAQTTIEVTATAVISFLCSLIVFGPNLKDINVPWSGGDMTATYINAETWNWWHYAVDTHYGFPYGMNLNYFPGLDITQNTFAQIVTMITGQPFIGINLLLILTFPIVAVMAYCAIRLMGLRGPLAIALGVAFTFIPWHWGRALGHLYLATLYGAVAGVILALLVGSGRLQLWLTCEDKRRRRWYFALIALLVVLAAWSAVYFSFFTGMMLVAALLWRVAQGDRMKKLVLGAVPLISLVLVAIIGLLPSILARASNPEVVNLGQRDPMDTVKYGGDLAISVLPAPYNPLLGGYNNLIGTMFAEAPTEEQNLLTNYGTWITSACLLVFIFGLVRYFRRRALNTWTPVDDAVRPSISFVGYLLMLMVLVFGPWSLNFLIANFLITQIRDWNRLLPLMLLLFILGAAAAIAGANWTRKSLVTFSIAAVIVMITIVDSIVPWKGLYDDVARGGRSIVDHGVKYAAAVNKAIPERCGVFQLPIMIYPENGIAEPNLNDYDHFLVGLTNKDKDFSYGAMRDTSASNWQLDFTAGVSGFQVQELKEKGFCAVHVDTRGFNQPEVITDELKTLFGKPVATGLDERWQLYRIK
ncbi:MAG: hypothetical protein Q8L05_12275 [Actinomycetota bacterium]|nr:hypothetical protein [Actinomycetota bacterium]MDP2287480.1 hypothetical protein [Actinomycetota bacterium]